MKVILDTNYVNVSFYEELSLARVKWKPGNFTFEDYKTAYIKALDFLLDNKVINFMADLREQSVVSPQFRQWFQDYVIPRGKERGIIRAAVIFNGNVFKKYYLNHIFNTTKKFGIPLKFFGKDSNAVKWFKSFEDYQ